MTDTTRQTMPAQKIKITTTVKKRTTLYITAEEIRRCFGVPDNATIYFLDDRSYEQEIVNFEKYPMRLRYEIVSEEETGDGD